MANWLKYTMAIVAIFGVIIVSMVMNTQSKVTNLSAKEVELAVESALVGEFRQANFKGMSVKEASANLIADVVNTQKDFNSPTRVDYAFLDKSGKVTEVEEEMTQIQFQIVVLDKSGKDVRALTSKRLALNVRQ